MASSAANLESTEMRKECRIERIIKSPIKGTEENKINDQRKDEV